MNSNLPFLISLLVSVIIHASLVFGVQYLHSSLAHISLKSGNVSRELAIHIMFTDPRSSSEDTEKAKYVTKISESETKPKENNQSPLVKQEIIETLQPEKLDIYILTPDEEPVPVRVREEILNKNEPELKTVSGRLSTQNIANPSGIKQKVIIPQTEKIKNVVVDLNRSLPFKQTSENTSHMKNGVLEHTKPEYIKSPPPEYPRLARKLEYTGKVTLKVEVKSDGNCGHVELVRSSGYSMLDNSAIGAVKEWRFTPAKKWGKAVSSFIEITVNFKLE